ncbi:transcription factor bHLH112-like [Salvia hispanica]|uniref:transcription factor bHLH112-like n=1 Tax=Salvia hispanica TaxID=49212 RepID=UPI00200992A7|nr:transcription factor bHLH112-like [Salvia hispanica]
MAEEVGLSWWNSPQNLFNSSPCSLGSFVWPTPDLHHHSTGVGLSPPDSWNHQDMLGKSEENYSNLLLDSSMNYRPSSKEDSSFGESYATLLQTLFDTDSQPLPSSYDHQTVYDQMNSNGFLGKPNVRPLLQPTTHFFQSSLSNQQQHEQAAAVKKASNQPAYKRPRIETPSPLPTFKVRKEKLGDRITALQQLVSPFGKTDTASVLHEAIEYIKYLHDQVHGLSTPYLKYGATTVPCQKRNRDEEGVTKDLKTRGLCLVPISSTFPVAAETSSDFWTPSFR